MSQELVNPELQRMAWSVLSGRLGQHANHTNTEKSAFIPGGDPNMDPAAGGGAPPPGGPPTGGGGAPPPPPDPGMDPGAIAAQAAQILSSQGGGMGGGAGAGGGGMGMGGGMVEPIKPKIDVNVELMQIKKMLAKLCDAMGVQIPAADMAVNSQDLTQMAMGQTAQPAQQSSIAPIQPMAPAAPGMGGPGKTGSDHFNNGKPFQNTMDLLSAKASAVEHVLGRRFASK